MASLLSLSHFQLNNPLSSFISHLSTKKSMIQVVKIGGNVIDDAAALERFLTKFAALEGPKMLIHGGGKLATRLSAQLGIETQMIDGRRVTDRATLDVVTMVYAGLVNKQIVARLGALGCKAIGLSGADANVIPAVRRAPKPIDYGYVGDIVTERMNVPFLASLVEQSIVPVFCAITHDEQGSLLNSNADSVASAVAVAASKIQPTNLIFCLEKNGVLTDVDDDLSVIPTITRESFATLRADGTVNKGMLPKIEGAFRAIDGGVHCVVIKHADNLDNDLETRIVE